jgi:hypothetical protein
VFSTGPKRLRRLFHARERLPTSTACASTGPRDSSVSRKAQVLPGRAFLPSRIRTLLACEAVGLSAYEVSPSTGPRPAVAGSSRRPQCRIRWSGRVCTRGKTLLDANTGASPRRAIAGSRGREAERQRLRRRQRGSGVGRCLASRERDGARRAPCSATQSAAWRSLLGRPSSRSPRSTNQPDRVAAEVLAMRRPGLRHVGPRLNGRSGTTTRPAPVAGGRSVASWGELA